MRIQAALAIAVGMAAGAATPVRAHHTIAYTYDVSRLVTLTGTVREVTWQFPHILIRMAVPNAEGGTDEWELESVNPQGARRAGLATDAIKVGDVIAIDGYVAKDGSHRAATESMTLAGGQTLKVSIRGTAPASK